MAVRKPIFPLEWTCHICEEIRPDEKISVAVHDTGIDCGFEAGIMTSNVRYCNDNSDCEEKAKSDWYPHHGNRFKTE